MKTQTTFIPTPQAAAADRRWYVVDAKDLVLGRLATRLATVLRGKHKPYFTPSVDCGDFVVVTNAAKIRLTGNKLEQKEYFSHSGYADGMKIMPVKRQMERDPRKVLAWAVKRMLDDNRHRSRQMKRLRIYPADQPAGKAVQGLPLIK